MHLDAGAIQRHHVDLEMDQLLTLQLGKHLVQDARFAPAAHAGVDGVPFAETLGKTAPFATMFCDIQDGVDDLEVGHADVASLSWQAMFYAGKLLRSKFHPDTIADQVSGWQLVLTGPSRISTWILWSLIPFS